MALFEEEMKIEQENSINNNDIRYSENILWERVQWLNL